MTGRLRTPALVLRSRAFQDDDLLLDFLGPGVGRVTVVARAARKNLRRYGGALELGTRVDAELTFRAGRDLQSLVRCEVTQPLRRIRDDLDRITALAYLMELVRLGAREGVGDDRLYTLAVSMVDVLEAGVASAEAILLWEVALLAHFGFGVTAEGLARECGLDATGRLAIDALWRGDHRVALAGEASVRLRQGLARIWLRTLGQAPRSARFLDGGAAAVSSVAP